MLTHFVQEMAPHETTRLFHPPPPIVLRSKPDCAPKKGVKHQNTIDEHSLPLCPFEGTTRHSPQHNEKQSNFSTIPIQVSAIIVIRLNFDVRKNIWKYFEKDF